MKLNRIRQTLLAGLALGVALVGSAAAQPDARPGFFIDALYPVLSPLPATAAAPLGRVIWRLRSGGPFGGSPLPTPAEILPTLPRFGLAIDHSTGQPQIVGLSFQPAGDIELRAATGWTEDDVGLEGHLSVSFRF